MYLVGRSVAILSLLERLLEGFRSGKCSWYLNFSISYWKKIRQINILRRMITEKEGCSIQEHEISTKVENLRW